uniref:uncharacterized protein LOC122597730 isoform X2 n=1 Tax=Erigeron canadensis TaxID=72917 RepID=UPI001CB8A730|nr:uncharacterized protein LOC122597730 isoform X2 [Erigeron canadensis]
MAATAESDHPRLILHNFLSPDLCKELEFIHKSCSTIGYRQNVFSTTLSHLIATNSSHLILPFIPIREKLKEKVEEFFGCEYELFVEFTGLISWTKGASIGWHSDDNRPYLKQRDYAAVCYLNSYGVDFGGGLFHFQDGEPTTFVPMAGDALIYTADSRNIHSVEEITDGERLTLTLWFSRDKSHDEDIKLISFLSKRQFDISDTSSNRYLPSPASQNMSIADEHSSWDISDILLESLRLARGNDLFDKEYVHVSHALQVVQFYHWKATELQISNSKMDTVKVIPISASQEDDISRLKLQAIKDQHLAEAIFLYGTRGESVEHDWVSFSNIIDLWEAYTSKLWHNMVLSLPHWIENQSIFYEPNGGA